MCKPRNGQIAAEARERGRKSARRDWAPDAKLKNTKARHENRSERQSTRRALRMSA